ncbi:MAG: hypothetical protein Q4P33_07375, partial [Flaviflexus sp.]|nr:hypothetical protein [Flaviflexus sp.]
IHAVRDTMAGSGVTKEDYEKGLYQLIAPELPSDTPKEFIGSVVECLADRTFDRVSGVTKKNVANAKDEVAERDVVLFDTYTDECGREVAEQLVDGN